MEAIVALLGIAGLLGFVGGVVWLLISLARRKALRKPGMLTATSTIVFIVAIVLAPPVDSDSQTSSVGEAQPTSTKVSTATPVPDEYVLSQLVTRTLGNSNREVERVRNMAFDEDERHLIIEWSINDNLTGGLRKSGAKRDVLGVLEAIRDSTVVVSRVTMRGSRSLVDVYGNVTEGDVVRASYDKETIDRINFENVRTDNAWIIADQIWILPDFQD